MATNITTGVIANEAVTFPKVSSTAIANQAEAEAGVATNKLMTPQRVAQANSRGVVGGAYGQRTTNIALGAAFPSDNTKPQSNEGTELVSVAYTVKSTANKIRMRAVLPVTGTANGTNGFALFYSDSTDALTAVQQSLNSSVAGVVALEVEFTPSSIGAKTFSLRGGAQVGATVPGTASIYGGAFTATLTVEEVRP